MRLHKLKMEKHWCYSLLQRTGWYFVKSRRVSTLGRALSIFRHPIYLEVCRSNYAFLLLISSLLGLLVSSQTSSSLYITQKFWTLNRSEYFLPSWSQMLLLLGLFVDLTRNYLVKVMWKGCWRTRPWIQVCSVPNSCPNHWLILPPTCCPSPLAALGLASPCPYAKGQGHEEESQVYQTHATQKRS